MIKDEKLSYNVTWYDELSSVDRSFTLSFWPSESSVEMVELNNKKLFLRKYKTSEIKESDLYIGNTVTLLSRQLRILDYADESTKEKEQHVQESTFGLVKPSHMREMGSLLVDVYSSGLSIAKAKQIQLTGSLAESLLRQFRGFDNFQEIVQSYISGPALALVLVGENSVEAWKELALGNIRLQNLEDGEHEEDDSGIYCSPSPEEAEREIHLFFPIKPHSNPFLSPRSTASLCNSTCCVILPHAVKERKAGQIIQSILEAGFYISALQTFHLDFSRAEEFFEIYKNVVENYGDMVKVLSNGLCFALEISWGHMGDERNGNGNYGDEKTIVEQFREFVGPRDPEIARKLRPSSLRARFGKQGCEYAVHCTDLPEDGKLEVEYFFRVLQ